LEKGEEKLNEYVNANYIWEVIMEHHKVLKELNKTKLPLRDKIYDYVINISSEEEAKPSNYSKVIPDVT